MLHLLFILVQRVTSLYYGIMFQVLIFEKPQSKEENASQKWMYSYFWNLQEKYIYTKLSKRN